MAKTDTAPQSLFERFRYDPETGHFHWLIPIRGFGHQIEPGDVAGTLKDGYVNMRVDGVLYRAHRLAWFVMTGVWLSSSQELDHINGDRADNRWRNLRLVTRSQNNMNQPRRRDNKSGQRGVSFRKDTQKWHARIAVDGKIILLGDYETLDAAVAVRLRAEAERFGSHSYLERTE